MLALDQAASEFGKMQRHSMPPGLVVAVCNLKRGLKVAMLQILVYLLVTLIPVAA